MNINSVIMDKRKCCGCTSCFNSCAVNAIEMISDNEGFLYPSINNDECINCGKCVRVCPIYTDDLKRNIIVNKAYAIINKNKMIRDASSSGGFFYSLAQYIIDNGGSVYGASFNENYEVQHIRISDIKDLNKIQGSKYVQSRLNSIFKDVKNDLLSGLNVVFSGTPCQINGLKKYLNFEYANLITVEIICHGVPSPKVWKNYLNYFKEKFGNIKSIFFRDESKSWEKYALRIKFGNNKTYIRDTDHDFYMKGFLQNLYLRPSCGICHFKDKYRVADFTIADFWGIKYIIPKMYDGHGISLVLLHSQNAVEVFGKLLGLKKMQVDYDEAIIRNLSFMNPSIPNEKRVQFFEELDRADDINELLYKYTKDDFLKRGIKILKGIVHTLKIK